MARKKVQPDLLSQADPAVFPDYLLPIAEKLSKTYEFVCEHHSGNSGQTYQIRQKADRAIYCLKTIKKDYPDKARVRKTLEKEVEILKPLSHRCLPKVYEADLKGELPFYVCTFHPGVTCGKFRETHKILSLTEATYIVISLIDTMEYLHMHGRTHCDLHEANILLGPGIVSDGLLIIDLGSGHRIDDSVSQTDDRGHLGFKPLEDIPTFRDLVERDQMNERWQMTDFIALGRLLALMREPFFGTANSDQRDALMSFASDLYEKRLTEWRVVKQRFEYVLDPNLLVTKFEKYILRKDGTRPQITLAATGPVRVGDATLALINSPAFQRLRGVKQLSFCEWYFPGATHTRFEHSLGVFSAMQSALRSACRQHEVRARFDQIGIDGALLASLVHDIGHYPLAHVIEHYIAGRYSTENDLRAQIHHANHSLEIIQTDPDISRLIEKYWGVDRMQQAIRTLCGKCSFLSDLIDGPIDCDKLDYLRRDAHHCGVTYGKGLNAEEIVNSFLCSRQSGRLVIPEEKVVAIEGMITAQDQMLSAVYWAKTTRALFAMFHRFLDIVIRKDITKLLMLVGKLKKCRSEPEATKVLLEAVRLAKPEHRKTAESLVALQGTFDFNKLYIPIQKYAPLDRATHNYRGDENIYRKIVSHNIFTLPSKIAPTSPIQWTLVQRLRAAYLAALRQKNVGAISDSDVLIDVPWGKPSSNMITVSRSDGSEVKITDVSHIAPSFFSLPAGHIAPVRVYVHPEIFPKVERYIESLTRAADELFESPEKLALEEDSAG